MRRLLAAAFAALVAIVGLSLTTANAATLEVATAPQLFVAQEAACGPGTANGVPIIDATVTSPGAAGSYSGITLSNIPTDCQGLDLPIDVFVHTTTGGLISSGSGTVGAGATSVGVGNYSGSAVTTVIARIGGWLFPTNWTAPTAPVVPFVSDCVTYSQLPGVAGPCTVTVTSVGEVETSNGGEFQEFSISVSHSVPQAKYWTANFNFDEIPGLQVPATRLGADWVNASALHGCGTFPFTAMRSTDYQFTPSWYIGEYPNYRVDICG